MGFDSVFSFDMAAATMKEGNKTTNNDPNIAKPSEKTKNKANKNT